MKTTLLVMTLNEINGMKAIMPQIDRAWCDQIIIVDGGSTDGTIEWIFCLRTKTAGISSCI
jgi:glycosyltransferase involved in cell wall biosynthesis